MICIFREVVKLHHFICGSNINQNNLFWIIFYTFGWLISIKCAAQIEMNIYPCYTYSETFFPLVHSSVDCSHPPTYPVSYINFVTIIFTTVIVRKVVFFSPIIPPSKSCLVVPFFQIIQEESEAFLYFGKWFGLIEL